MKKLIWMFFIFSAVLVAGCFGEPISWDLPHENPLDPAINPSASLPQVQSTLILSNSEAILRGQLVPYSPSFNGLVALEWRGEGGDWTRVAASENSLGAFDSPLSDLTPGATYASRAIMMLEEVELASEERLFFMPFENEELGCTDQGACNYDPNATFNDGSCEFEVTYWLDLDEDGFGDEGMQPVSDCPPLPENAVMNGTDCDDALSSVYPGAVATAEGVDNDCSGEIENDEELPNIDLPSISTNVPGSITASSAVSGGTISDEGGASVTSRGVVVSTSVNPTLEDDVFYSGDGGGFFTTNIMGLESSTTYHVRGFATNQGGTAYGASEAFTTSSPPPILMDQWNCESLAGVTSSFYYWDFSSYETAPWIVANNGYVGSCWRAPNDDIGNTLVSGSHYVEFPLTFGGNGFLEFWLNSANPGYPNTIPNFYVDGFQLEAPTMIAGSTSGFEWMQVRTADISAGAHTIRIEFTSAYYVYSIDEIDVFEYP